MDRQWLYRGMVSHTRLLPREHRFSYPALFICFPLQEKFHLQSRLFSLNRFNLFSYHETDHGDGKDGEAWVRGILATHNITTSDGAIYLLCLPRMLGFVFNPVSFWLCHDRSGVLRAVLCEVNNTFGERHCYLLQAADGLGINAQTDLQAQKVFHVSPFLPVRGEYHFRFQQFPDLRSASINYLEDGQLLLKTVISGRAQTLNDAHLLRLFFALGWSTVLVVLRIHWQALKLWRKGIPFHRKPHPPVQEISR